jgi:hypothetical protein
LLVTLRTQVVVDRVAARGEQPAAVLAAAQLGSERFIERGVADFAADARYIRFVQSPGGAR